MCFTMISKRRGILDKKRRGKLIGIIVVQARPLEGSKNVEESKFPVVRSL